MIYSGATGLTDLRETVEYVKRRLRKPPARVPAFDAIAVQGMSGVLVGAPVSLALGLPLVLVRKPSDVHHRLATKVISGAATKQLDALHFLFLDDFRSTGATEKRVALLLRDKGAEVVARFFYRRGWAGGYDGWQLGAWSVIE